MGKYLSVIKNTWEEMFVYRLNFLLWRIRVVIQLLTIYFLWLSILPSNTSFGSYNQSMMLTYILGTSIVFSIVMASRSQSIGDEINSGDLSNYLLKPINYFSYWFSRDIADKAINIAMSFIEMAILIFLMRPPLFVQLDPFYLFTFIIFLIISTVLYFFINVLIGLIGFWTPEIWAPRFIFFTVLSFFAGNFFPLDLLPKSIYQIAQYLPFTYLLYFPIKIYLGQLNLAEIGHGLIVTLIWTTVFYLLVKFFWQKGLKNYTAQGR